ncbi:unnamed protein product [Soboliphyme baturini]|uniref:ZZ-type domain-containing protein n=1 Tax=Soboliphyme baturini TaxID=241478 RepID=A0A183IQR9_9BILA|nr:unnamed protein product [Soboliphyme baturini]
MTLQDTRVTLNIFLDTLMTDPCPPCLMWIPLLHRMASVEHVFHPVVCDGCSRDSFTGFRYKCQRCHNYQLCQDCFWRGRVSGTHTNQHEMKEYSSYKSPTKQLSHSISKSLQCVPSHSEKKFSFSDYPDRPLDLANVVPTSPSLVRSNVLAHTDEMPLYGDIVSDSHACLVSPGHFSVDERNTDDEHKLIARYSAKLSGRATYLCASMNSGLDENGSQRAAVARLEQKNKEILREIQKLQAMQSANSLAGMSAAAGSAENGLALELDSLRQRKTELELRMEQLRDTRQELMSQLESLMQVLKLRNPQESSPRSQSSMGLPLPEGRRLSRDFEIPAEVDELGSMTFASATPQKTLPFGSQNVYSPRKSSLQTDLLSAADSITNTMTTLVKELGSEEAMNTTAENGESGESGGSL